jgi:hypothetical protein
VKVAEDEGFEPAIQTHGFLALDVCKPTSLLTIEEEQATMNYDLFQVYKVCRSSTRTLDCEQTQNSLEQDDQKSVGCLFE